MDRYVTPLPSSESLKSLPPRGNIPLGISCWSSFVSHLTTLAVISTRRDDRRPGLPWEDGDGVAAARDRDCLSQIRDPAKLPIED